MSQISYIDPERFTIPPGPTCDPYWGAVQFLLEADTTITDGSFYNRAVTVSGAVASTTQVKVGTSSVFFDGVNDRISSSIQDAIGTDDFTIEFWVYSSGAAATSPRGHLIDFRTASTQAAIDLFWCYNNTTSPITGAVVGAINFYYNGAIVTATNPLTQNVWHHVALCRSNFFIGLFINGYLVGEPWLDRTSYSQTTFYVGSNYVNDSTGPFYGHVDSLRITEGVSRYFERAPPQYVSPPTAPYNYAAFGYTDYDTFANSLNLSYRWRLNSNFSAAGSSEASIGSSPSILLTKGTGSSTGQLITSGLLNGTSDHSALYQPSAGFFSAPIVVDGTQGFTIGVWARRLGTGSCELWGTNLGTGGFEYTGVWLGLYDTTYYLQYGNNTNVVSTGRSSWGAKAPPYTAGETVFVVFYSGPGTNPSTIVKKIYINGIEYPISYLSGGASNIVWNNPGSFTFASRRLTNSDAFNGSLDDFFFTYGELSASDILQLYQKGTTVPDNVVAAPSLYVLPNAPTLTTGDRYYRNVGLLMHMEGNINDQTGKTGTSVGSAATTTAQSKFGTRSLLIGNEASNQGVTFVDSTDWHLSSADFTIEAWIRPTSFYPSLLQAIVTQGPWNSTTAMGWGVYYRSNQLYFEFSEDGNYNNSFSGGFNTTFNIDQWHHVAITRRGPYVSYWKDGQRLGYYYWGPPGNIYQRISLIDVAQVLRVGHAIDSTSAVVNEASAYIDDVRITKGVDRYSGTGALPAETYTVPTAAFDDTSSVTLDGTVDLSGNNIAITPRQDANTIDVPTPIGTSTAMMFDNRSWYDVTDNNVFNFSTSDFSIEMWASVNGPCTLVSHWTPGNASTCAWKLDIQSKTLGGSVTDPVNEYTLVFSYGNGSTNTAITASTSSLKLYDWNHVVVTRVTNRLYFYVNGIRSPASYNLYEYITNNNNSVTIGSDGGTNGTGGTVVQYATGKITNLLIKRSAYRSNQSVTSFAPNLIVFPTIPCGDFLDDSTVNDIPITLDAESANVLYNPLGTLYDVPVAMNQDAPANILYNPLGTLYDVPIDLNNDPANVLYTGLRTNDDTSILLLMLMDGTNGSTTFTDQSFYSRTITRNGNTIVSTTESKFGGSSAYFDGTGDWLYSSVQSGDVRTGDFTIEGWFRWSALTNGGLFHVYPGTPASVTTGLALGYDGTNFQIYSSGGATAARLYTPTVGTWYHIAVVRSSGLLTLYVNGTAQGATISDSIDYGGNGVNIGLYYSSSFTFNGYIDEFRVTKGIARYTSNFSVPSVSFSTTTYSVPLSLQPNISGSGVAGAVLYRLIPSVAPITMSLDNTIDVYALVIATLPATTGELIEYEVYATSVSTAPITIAL